MRLLSLHILHSRFFFFFFFNDTATTEIYTLSLHDALPILSEMLLNNETSYVSVAFHIGTRELEFWIDRGLASHIRAREDRKSTRLNSSHLVISYAVFCLKKKKTKHKSTHKTSRGRLHQPAS